MLTEDQYMSIGSLEEKTLRKRLEQRAGSAGKASDRPWSRPKTWKEADESRPAESSEHFKTRT